MSAETYETYETEGVPIKAFTRGVFVEPKAIEQLHNVAQLPIVHRHIAVMPDVHWGIGATVGSVVPTVRAIIPAAVGVDIGCGMMAFRTRWKAQHLPDNLAPFRSAIEAAVPHGRTNNGGPDDRGAWSDIPSGVASAWSQTRGRFQQICAKHPALMKTNNVRHLGTLGTGNHFIELCLDEGNDVWVMLHSGSRGVGGRIGSYFIELAKKDAARNNVHLPDLDLAYFREGSDHFDDYVDAMSWAQDFARTNRELMMSTVLSLLDRMLPPVEGTPAAEVAVNCHHNYVSRETHFGEEVLVTRKGAVSARTGELGIIPGSMGTRSFIVRGKGNPDSFCSCSHGAGRRMSRNEAKRTYTLADHAAATRGIECRKDEGVLDETPAAYKDIEAVMAAQRDLIEVVHTLKQVVCVKG
jgi:tRNA-splicing ligase RtcB